MLVEAFASAALAWMTERTEERDSEAKRRQTQLVFCRGKRPRPRLERQAHIYRRSTAASRPQESFISRDSASGQASWDVAGTRFAHPFERALLAPACP